jgi:hypothetical protein
LIERPMTELYHISWYQNGDRLDVAAAVNRLVAAGVPGFRLPAAVEGAEAGDYLVELSPALAEALRRVGIRIAKWTTERPAGMEPLAPVAAAVLAGRASAYPYYGYYALALARLGYSFRSVSGGEIAAEALQGENLLILPGGFSNWSLDAKEETSGADDAVRAFLLDGGRALASCGGAYYLAKGRPTWLGVADAKPLITQDYLRTGVGVVTCRLTDGRQRLGLPPTLEVPYFHGPAFDEVGAGCEPLATFRDLAMTGRLFIDNPLTSEIFDRYMRDRIAVMNVESPRGRAMLFSPHPEMGDLLVKYMALESYVPQYLPIRGDLVMRETLDAYRPEESRAFLMILNAIEALSGGARAITPHTTAEEGVQARAAADKADAFGAAWERRAAGITHSASELGAIERHVFDGLKRRLEPALVALRKNLPTTARSHGDGPRLAASFAALASDAVTAWAVPLPPRRPAELLLELELALLLMEAWARLSHLHNTIGEHV